MHHVTLKLYATLRKKAGIAEMQCEAATVRDAMAALAKKVGPENEKHVKMCNVFLNSNNITALQGPLTKLKEGDTLHIFPPMGGG